jgi:hypothetical protein
MEKTKSRRFGRSAALTGILAVAAVAGFASPALAFGNANSSDNTYHGRSSVDDSGFVNVLTYHDNTKTNTVCSQVRTDTSPGYTGVKKCGTGTVNENNNTSYYNQAGGLHWGGSASATPFKS